MDFSFFSFYQNCAIAKIDFFFRVQVASDMLMLISEQVDRVLSYHQDLPKRIVEVLSR